MKPLGNLFFNLKWVSHQKIDSVKISLLENIYINKRKKKTIYKNIFSKKNRRRLKNNRLSPLKNLKKSMKIT